MSLNRRTIVIAAKYDLLHYNQGSVEPYVSVGQLNTSCCYVTNVSAGFTWCFSCALLCLSLVYLPDSGTFTMKYFVCSPLTLILSTYAVLAFVTPNKGVNCVVYLK